MIFIKNAGIFHLLPEVGALAKFGTFSNWGGLGIIQL